MAQHERVHGSSGAYVGGEWVDIEECASLFNVADASGCAGACSACPRSRSRHTAAKPDGSYDVVVIGAGCIGAAVARELAKTTASVLLLEAADDVTQGATKGNSGIVHAGYDDLPGSVKARFCWPGNQMFPQLDRELHFGFERNGSLVVATDEAERKVLLELMERGHKNGVENLRIVEQDELRSMEPHVDPAAVAALYSPDAGTIIPYEYTIALAENAVDNGVEVRIRRVVHAIEQHAHHFVVRARHWEPAAAAPAGAVSSRLAVALVVFVAASALMFALLGEVTVLAVGVALALGVAALLFSKNPKSTTMFSPSPGTELRGPYEEEEIRTKYIVNCAGCKSDEIAHMVGDHSFKIKPRLGEYILLHKKEGHKASHTLFPTPHPVLGKGVLVQSTLWGNLILGPTARDTLKKDEASGEWVENKEVTEASAESIYRYILKKCKNLVPSIDASQVIHTFSGARAKNTTGDWIIKPCDTAPRMIHAAGIDSPGIAGSPAIALEVCRLLEQAGAPITEKDPSFNPIRAPIVVPKKGWKGLKAGPPGKHQDPSQNVVCKCEKVTEAEVIEACRRSLPIDSTQAIRKRTRAGMGHCQGDPDNYDCESRVAAIIAREQGIPEASVGRRPWPASSLLSKRWIDDDERARIASYAE